MSPGPLGGCLVGFPENFCHTALTAVSPITAPVAVLLTACFLKINHPHWAEVFHMPTAVLPSERVNPFPTCLHHKSNYCTYRKTLGKESIHYSQKTACPPTPQHITRECTSLEWWWCYNCTIWWLSTTICLIYSLLFQRLNCWLLPAEQCAAKRSSKHILPPSLPHAGVPRCGSGCWNAHRSEHSQKHSVSSAWCVSHPCCLSLSQLVFTPYFPWWFDYFQAYGPLPVTRAVGLKPLRPQETPRNPTCHPCWYNKRRLTGLSDNEELDTSQVYAKYGARIA